MSDEDVPIVCQAPRTRNGEGPATANRRGAQKPRKSARVQSIGAAIGLTPARSSRLTRIATTVMISASSAIPAETRYPLAKPVEYAWSVITFCAAACWAADRCTVACFAAAVAAATCAWMLLATALHATVHLSAAQQAALQKAMSDHAIATGFSKGYLVSAGIALLALIITLVAIRVKREDLAGVNPMAAPAD